MNRPLVSCVMIFFNGEAYIDEAIRSVVAQQAARWELILVDDGSTDASTEIARRWAASDPQRIRLIHHPGRENRGMSAARNLGIASAVGDYVAFLDCDDVWLPHALAHLSRLSAAHPSADAIIAGTRRWRSWSGDPADAGRDNAIVLPPVPRRETIAPPALFAAIYSAPGSWFVPTMCGLMVRRAALAAVGGMESEFRGMYEDQVLYTKISTQMNVVVDDRPIALYRQHDQSACAMSIASGEWDFVWSSPAERAFLAWQRDAIAERFGPASPLLAIVDANLARPAEPTSDRPSVRSALVRRARRALRPLRRFGRRIRQLVRMSGPLPAPDPAAEWTREFLGAWRALRTGSVVVVVDDPSQPARSGWTDDVAAAAARGPVRLRSWADLDAAERADHVIVLLPSGDGPSVTQLQRAAAALSPGGTLSAVVRGAVDPELFHGREATVETFSPPGGAALTAVSVWPAASVEPRPSSTGGAAAPTPSEGDTWSR